MKALKTIAWAVAGLILSNPANNPTWVQIASAHLCALMSLKATGEYIKEELKHD